MRIGINASFLRKAETGIGQVTLNFLQKLSEFKVQSEKFKVNEFEFILYLEEKLPAGMNLPENFQTRVFLPFYKRDDLIRRVWWEKCLLPKKAKRDKCDVLISLYQSVTVTSGGVKHLMVVHDIIPKLFPEYLNNSRKKLYQSFTEHAVKKADKIVAISTRTEKDLIQHLGIYPDKISVSHISCDEIYKKPVSTEASGEGYLLGGGGLEVRKNVEGLIRAYKLLLDRNNNEYFVPKLPNLVIYGKLAPQLAPLVTDAEKLVKELNLSHKVKLLGVVPQKEMPTVFANALIFIYPSFYEGFGLPVLEAMSQGTPVITSKVSALPEVGGDSVVYCDPDDPKDIAMVIKNLLVNKSLRDELSKRGKERANRFNWRNFVEKILHIIKNK